MHWYCIRARILNTQASGTGELQLRTTRYLSLAEFGVLYTHMPCMGITGASTRNIERATNSYDGTTSNSSNEKH